MIDEREKQRLCEAAAAARQRAYVPYSGFHVGAALLTAGGEIYTGCNIENAAYSPTNCAERTAVFKAVSDGILEFAAIAIISDSEDYCAPCGVCRQVLAEFCSPDFLLLLCRRDGACKEYTLGSLLPESFGRAAFLP